METYTKSLTLINYFMALVYSSVMRKLCKMISKVTSGSRILLYRKFPWQTLSKSIFVNSASLSFLLRIDL